MHADDLEDQVGEQGQDEIDHRDDEVRSHEGIGLIRGHIGFEIKLRHADDIEDAGILDVDDPLIPDRGDGVTKRLRKDDGPEGLRAG